MRMPKPRLCAGSCISSQAYLGGNERRDFLRKLSDAVMRGVQLDVAARNLPGPCRHDSSRFTVYRGSGR